jgi:hypothetical protein
MADAAVRQSPVKVQRMHARYAEHRADAMLRQQSDRGLAAGYLSRHPHRNPGIEFLKA